MFVYKRVGRMDGKALSVFPKAENLLIHSGNVINWNRLKVAVAQSAASELNDCLKFSVESFLESADLDSLQYATCVDCPNAKLVEKLLAEERLELKLTVKIFISTLNSESIIDAINQVMLELGVSFIEAVILSVPEEHKDLCKLETLWAALEEQVACNRVYSLGISDLSKQQLEDLFNWAKVKPRINQVNLTSCCVIPQDLSEYAKENDIQLLTHNDPPVILSSDEFQTLMSDIFKSPTDSVLWQPSWVIRYSVLIKCRGVIKSKGYLMRAVRDVKKLPYTPTAHAHIVSPTTA